MTKRKAVTKKKALTYKSADRAGTSRILDEIVELFADASRVLRQWAENELYSGGRNLFR